MNFKNMKQVNDFLAIVEKCEGGVYLNSEDGDVFNLKSRFSQYIAIGELLSAKGDELKLVCDHREDWDKFFEFFKNIRGV